MNASSPHALRRLAIIGAGPVGLTLALEAAARLPNWQIRVHDALPADHDVSGDPRALALSRGTLQVLERLGLWRELSARTAPIRCVHVSQQPPSLAALSTRLRDPELTIDAVSEGVDQLGGVLHYGTLVAPMRRRWLELCQQHPERLSSAFGTKVTSADPAELQADLVVIAEGGVFADQARRAIARDYQQTAWVGTVEIDGGDAGTAFERFTTQGPVALLPLPTPAGSAPGRRRAALVWCVRRDDDPVGELDTTQRLAVLSSILPPAVGRLVGLSPLKSFALGLNAERRLVEGRCVRIGNAAQTLHPVAGQGLNLGLRDVMTLVEALRQHRHDPDAALRQMSRLRTPDRWALMATTDFLARSFTWELPGLRTLRGLGLAALEAAPPFKSLLARQMMYGWR
jgi:2-octaprenyl-6-methoxyphenol hydroxylase